jgi:hypothetical protein
MENSQKSKHPAPIARAVVERNIDPEDAGDYIVAQRNDLIEAKWTIGKIELKIVKFLMSLIHPSDEEFKTYILKKKDLLDILGMGEKNHTALKRHIKKLQASVVEINSPSGWGFRNLLYKSDYLEADETIRLCLHREMRDYWTFRGKSARGAVLNLPPIPAEICRVFRTKVYHSCCKNHI